MALRLLIAFFMLVVPLELPGCGPFIPEALYSLKLGPEQPEAEFARGKLGVLQRTYKRFYLVIAYRYLSGVGLNDAERAALFPPEQKPADSVPPQQPWLDARKPVQSFEINRQSFQPNTYEYFQNCGDDAFRTAAATLKERERQFGASSPLVADWIAAQDIVFLDCSAEKPLMPPPASDPRLAADRAYQVAAAKFYSGQYDAAHTDFEKIAGDAKSPWHEIAPYVAARCWIRKGDYAKAAQELRAVAADSSRPRWREPSRKLLQYVETQADPSARIHELAQSLMKPRIGAAIAQDLDDYRLLMDKVGDPAIQDDLTDWIHSYQTGSRDHILEMWRKTHSQAWLVAALDEVKTADAATPELVKAAAELKPDSPAYLTATWHAVQLMPDDTARAKTDEILKLPMPVSARNLFRHRRFELARDFSEFLLYAPRTVVGKYADLEWADLNNQELLAADSAWALNHMPLSMLKQAALSQSLPSEVRARLERVIWVRTVLLSAAPSFDDVYKLLKTPGLGYEVVPGFGRFTKDIAEIDPYRDNWWCSAQPSDNPGAPLEPGGNGVVKPGLPVKLPAFLTPEEVAQGKREWDRLTGTPIAADWLPTQAVAWAQKMPNDPRIPEALHLAVRATRYGCTDNDTGTNSKRAYDLLHQRYPNSTWAAQTKYWFK